MTLPQRESRPRRAPRVALDADDALLALVVAAMNANAHVSPEEGARAQHIIMSTRRFRRRSGEEIGRRLDRVRTLLETHGAAPVVQAAGRAIGARLGPSAYAVAADVVLVDGRLESAERRFLTALARALEVDPATARAILDVIRTKNAV